MGKPTSRSAWNKGRKLMRTQDHFAVHPFWLARLSPEQVCSFWKEVAAASGFHISRCKAVLAYQRGRRVVLCWSICREAWRIMAAYEERIALRDERQRVARELNRWLSLDEAAQLLQTTPSTFLRLAGIGKVVLRMAPFGVEMPQDLEVLAASVLPSPVSAVLAASWVESARDLCITAARAKEAFRLHAAEVAL